jgi:hypothetical protein
MSPCPPHLIQQWLQAESAGRQAAAEQAFGAALQALPQHAPSAEFAAGVMTRVAPLMPAWAQAVAPAAEPLLTRVWVRSLMLLLLLWAAALTRLLPLASLVADPAWRPAAGVHLLANAWVGIATALRGMVEAMVVGQVAAEALRGAAGTPLLMLMVVSTLALSAAALMALRYLLEPQSIYEKS